MSEMKTFKANIGVVTAASLFSFAISLALTPVMTRFYDPSNYGAFSLVNNLATFVATLALLSLPSLIPYESKVHKRRQIARAILQLSCVAFGASAVLAAAWFLFADDLGIGAERWVAWTMPILVAAIMFQRFAQAWNQAKGDFLQASIGRVVHPLVAKLGAVLMAGFMGAYALNILVLEVLGYLLQARIILGRGWKNWLKWTDMFSWRRMRISLGLIRTHRDMTLHGNASGLLVLAATSVQGVAATYFFSLENAGLFSLAMSIASLPVQLVSMASAPVVYQKMLDTARQHPKKLLRLSMIVGAGYMAIGSPVYFGIYWLGPDLFRFAFGVKWSQAGEMASILALPMWLYFVVMPLSSILMVTRQQRKGLMVDLIFLPFSVLVFVAISTAFDMLVAVAGLAIVMSLHRIVQAILGLVVAYKLKTQTPH
jgi:O-antigen/teichoic acid export membrane protein